MLLVTKHINAIEVRLVQLVWLALRRTLFQYHPTPRPSLLCHIFGLCGWTLVACVLVEPSPRNKITTSSVVDNIARNRQLELLSNNPSFGRMRYLWRQSHLVPELGVSLFIRLLF